MDPGKDVRFSRFRISIPVSREICELVETRRSFLFSGFLISAILVRLAYLYSRSPVLSQTFCDTEMLALEQLGFSFPVGSIHSPLTAFGTPMRPGFRAPSIMRRLSRSSGLWEEKTRTENRWPEALIATHEQKSAARSRQRPVPGMLPTSLSCSRETISTTSTFTLRTGRRIRLFS